MQRIPNPKKKIKDDNISRYLRRRLYRSILGIIQDDASICRLSSFENGRVLGEVRKNLDV
jgi:hypothetical protein